MTTETRVGLFLLLTLTAIMGSTLFLENIKLFQRVDDYEVDFKDVEALPPKSAVKISGVEIGKVKKISLVDGRARVTIGIDPDIVLYADARSRIGSTGIIGSRFVELEPGSPELPPLQPGSIIKGESGASLNAMVSKISTLFDNDSEYGNAVDNLKASVHNIRQITDALNGALGQREKDLSQIVTNIRDLTKSGKNFMADLEEISKERKEDVKLALLKFRQIGEKLDLILAKIEGGEGAIGALVSDKKTGEEVKEAISSIKDTAASAKKVIGRFTLINTYWNYRLRYDTRDNEARSDAGITFVPRPGKFYAIGATNLGKPISNEKNLEYERKNRITAVMGADLGPFTGYAGAIRSDGGVGLNFRPFWFSKKWERRFELNAEASDFSRDRTVRGRRLDRSFLSAGARLAMTRWWWLGVRVEDILERSAFMLSTNVVFRDEDLAYLLGFASFAR